MSETTEATPKRNKRKVTVNEETRSVTITEADVSTTYALDLVPVKLHNRIAVHGLSQILTDSSASQSSKAGFSAAERKATLDAKFAQLVAGDMKATRTSQSAEGKELLTKKYEATVKIVTGEYTGSMAAIACQLLNITEANLQQCAKTLGVEWEGIKSEEMDEDEEE